MNSDSTKLLLNNLSSETITDIVQRALQQQQLTNNINSNVINFYDDINNCNVQSNTLINIMEDVKNEEGDKLNNGKINNSSIVNNSKSKILQKIPLIIPTSQFMLKPGQTLLKINKNVKLIQNANKIDNSITIKNNPQFVYGNNPAAISPQLIVNSNETTVGNKFVVNQSNPPVLKENNQQFIANSSNVVYTTINSNSLSGPLLKPIQIVRTNVLPDGKTLSSPVILKKQNGNLTLATTSTNETRPISLQQPVSILKPQVKSAGVNIAPKLPQNQQTNVQPNNFKLITNVESKDKIIKVPEKSDLILKKSPLGSNNNPIEIIQQGQTFHSMQKLTPAQLKQIVNLLQQRKQQITNQNERVVYRVVFPEDLDLRMRDPMNSLLKSSHGKRGRPKKKTALANKSLSEEAENAKEEKKKIVARTRSGRLSRPPKHIVRDYKRLHHLDFTEPDIDDSDGGYSDYNTNVDKFENDPVTPDLLSGYEGPKRKISDSFRCPTCSKIYLGRSRMAKHFSLYPDHGSHDQLPPISDRDIKSYSTNPGKKGKKRGPWAYITPEAKSERRQVKLKEALSACENDEILKIAAKPVLNSQSLFDLMLMKSDNNVKNFLNELKSLMKKTREQINSMLKPINNPEKNYENVIELNDELLCNTLNLLPGFYSINNNRKNEQYFNTSNQNINLLINNSTSSDEPPNKLQKISNGNNDNEDENDEDDEDDDDDCKENNCSFDNNSNDFDNVDFSNDKRLNANCCPDVLTALTLIPRNLQNNLPKFVLNNQQLDDVDFKKLDIDNNAMKEGEFTRLDEHLKSTSNNCSNIFPKMEMFETKLENEISDNLQQSFVKVEPIPQCFIKLENNTVASFTDHDLQNFDKLSSNEFDETETFSKEFSKIIPSPNESNQCQLNINNLSLIQNNSTSAVEAEAITNYDLDLLKTSHVEIDKHLVDQLNLVDQSKLDDAIVSESLDNILDNSLISNNTNLDTELDFGVLSQEFH